MITILKCICLHSTSLGVEYRTNKYITEQHKIYDYWIHQSHFFYVIVIDKRQQYAVDPIIFEENFISLDNWRDKQIDTILNDECR